jgi:D-cysteine desulfhydrase
MADVLAKNATAVITIGSVRSNHARITAMVARRLGLRCVLVLNGNSKDNPAGNHLIMKMLGVEIVPVETRDDRLPVMAETAARLRREGERVYTIPLGASDEIGSFGLTAAFEEMRDYEKEAGVRFDAVVFPSSSGGTQAGLEVGRRLAGREDLRILGISPDDPAASIGRTVVTVANKMLKRLGLRNTITTSDIHIDDVFIGPGYGLPSSGSEEALRLFAQTEGILLDPVYTVKAAAALIEYCRRGVFKPDENALFWHTGGLIGLFG